jgi:PiT family inorganic phosphate transporter
VLIAVALVVLVLAFANGANDNFKGVASLLGSGTTSYRATLAWATATTLAGSAAAAFLAHGLVVRFQGKGLVPPEVAADPGFLLAVALGAGATVLLATRLGLPTSTTHALTGALVGAGLAVAGSVDLTRLGAGFALPLLTSPILALFGTAALYPLLRAARARLGVTRETCLCVGERVVERVGGLDAALAAERRRELALSIGERVTCREAYDGTLVGLPAARMLDGAHMLSAGAVGFARGLNDTPKIAALLLVVPAFGSPEATAALVACGVAIAVGGVLGARRVARTMSYGITPMNAGQGFASNLVTALLVVFASRFGLPVSTTHVACGALFGIGIVRGDAHVGSIRAIVLAWVLTLPLAGILAWTAARAI